MVIELLVLALLLAAPVAMMLATRVVIVASPWRVPFALAFVVWAIAGVASLPTGSTFTTAPIVRAGVIGTSAHVSAHADCAPSRASLRLRRPRVADVWCRICQKNVGKANFAVAQTEVLSMHYSIAHPRIG